jgi:hypothetical protein
MHTSTRGTFAAPTAKDDCPRRLKVAPRRFKPKILDMHSRRLANFLREQPGKVAWAHGRKSSEHID